MAYSEVHPPKKDDGRYIHPMEVTTDLELELEVCVMYLHEGLIDWEKRPWEERYILRRWWYRHRHKEAYYSTPEKERANFFFR